MTLDEIRNQKINSKKLELINQFKSNQSFKSDLDLRITQPEFHGVEHVIQQDIDRLNQTLDDLKTKYPGIDAGEFDLVAEEMVLIDQESQEEYNKSIAIVSMRQARLVLNRHGLLDSVTTAIAAIEDATQRKEVEIEWEYATEINADHQWVKNLSIALGLTQEQLNNLFAEAVTL